MVKRRIVEDNWNEMSALRLTGLYAFRALWALQGFVHLGRLRLPRFTAPTFLQPWSLLRKALIRAGKTSQTAGTLCDIPPKICWNCGTVMPHHKF
jgi:hypothetical protein